MRLAAIKCILYFYQYSRQYSDHTFYSALCNNLAKGIEFAAFAGMANINTRDKPGLCCIGAVLRQGLRIPFVALKNLCLWFLLLLPVYPAYASEDVFGQLVEMRRAANLFHQNRYRDSVDVFEPIYESLNSAEKRDPERLSTVLGFLAQGKSFLGEHAESLELLTQRLAIAGDLSGEQSEEYASILAAVAEARYRNGDVDGALKTVTQAIEGLENNVTGESDYLELARINLVKYSSGKLSNASLPVDLSEFYTRCESIIRGEDENSVSMKMGAFVEVGIDYKPEGFWAAMFEIAAKGPNGTARQGSNYRRIFLAGPEEVLRQELCVVDQRSGIVISAENSLE